jgi:hypothetical protein
MAGAEMPAPAATAAPPSTTTMSHAEHLGLHFDYDISLDIPNLDVAQDISLIWQVSQVAW